MSRYIDADEMKSIKSIQSANFNSIESIREWIDAQPTADVRENVKGEWIPQDHNKTNGMTSTAVYYYPMPIELQKEKYCDDCPMFAPVATRMHEWGDGTVHTIITCEDQYKCEHLVKCIEKHIREES